MRRVGVSTDTDDMLIALIHLCLLIRPHALVRHFLRRALLDMCSPCKRGLFWPIPGLMQQGVAVCWCVGVCWWVCVVCVGGCVYACTRGCAREGVCSGCVGCV